MYCEFVWTGSMPWVETHHGCTQGTICTPPSQPGTLIDEHATVECEGPT